MKNILELFHDLPHNCDGSHEQDSPFMRTARIKYETMEMLDATMTPRQKELLEAYFDADTSLEALRNTDSFRYAFHLGAQLMAEMIQGREEILR